MEKKKEELHLLAEIIRFQKSAPQDITWLRPCVPRWLFKVVAAMCSKVPHISKAIMKATGCDSFNLLVNSGTAAGQVIFHTHIHIIPRKKLDCLWASESLRRHSLKRDREAFRLADRIREELSPSNNSEDIEDQGSSFSRPYCKL
ncbi:HIT-like domain [Dillenia turbinata]|uniref:HIT-like domain n=1 Tax=Dillenia turbinata TaxID=194707 RepID=A0AAN8VXE8_9MAGN